jgi:protein ImuA
MPEHPAQSIAALRETLAQAQGRRAPAAPPIRFGIPALDAHLPGGGLARAALHEAAGAGPDIEHAAAAALFVAGVCAGLDAGKQVLWVLERGDLFAPALAGVGLHPDRVIYAEARRPKLVLLAIEDALRHRGLAGVVGELSGALSLTASRRLQLARETATVPVFLLRRSRRHDDPVLAAPNAASTRWRVAALPSAPPLPHAPEVPGFARARWRLDLVRCRGGEANSWIVEACDAQGRLGLPAEFRHRPAAAAPRRAAAG